MIVDDHAAFRQVVKAQLQTIGVECVECKDGRDALVQYPLVRPDLVLMDIAMKELDGLGATVQLKASYAGARVCMLTEYDDPDLREAAKRAGASAYLLKEDLSQLPALLGLPLATPPAPSSQITANL
jgi:CheY-like chemotaxis protein